MPFWGLFLTIISNEIPKMFFFPKRDSLINIKKIFSCHFHPSHFHSLLCLYVSFANHAQHRRKRAGKIFLSSLWIFSSSLISQCHCVVSAQNAECFGEDVTPCGGFVWKFRLKIWKFKCWKFKIIKSKIWNSNAKKIWNLNFKNLKF